MMGYVTGLASAGGGRVSDIDPAIAQSISTLIGAIATAILMYASFHWGPSSRRKRRKEDEDEDQ